MNSLPNRNFVPCVIMILMDKFIEIIGARSHNLKNIDCRIPRGKITVITGISGSGKSSLAFDTLFAEGQRRYIESLSTYARQFLEKMDRPDVEAIHGIPPAIAIEQKNSVKNARSTVGTASEVYDYLRLLFAKIGEVFCPECHLKVSGDTVEGVVEQLLSTYQGIKILVLSPVSLEDGQEKESKICWVSDKFIQSSCHQLRFCFFIYADSPGCSHFDLGIEAKR